MYNTNHSEPYSSRNIDKDVEKEIAKFCDEHIYCNNIKFNRCNDAELQKAGVDGYLSIPSLNIDNAATDEKAGSHYVNTPIKTYLMELSQITKSGEEVDGWLLSDKNQTEYYNLMYLWANVPTYYDNTNKLISDWSKIKSNNITLIEYYLVKKDNILSYLNECGFDKDRLHKAVKYLRDNTNINRVKTKYGFKFVISRQFKECPVNVCIDKDIYNKICTLHRYVGKYDYELIR
jgi:hypothetical protein